ncbi:MAG: tetratricopeptide repeat protein [Deltaproteobacteria bacterium]|nr:tetratricopeptide repeat protein [Deltaproteobacteria bacterium]
MYLDIQAAPSRISGQRALAVGLLVFLALTGCGESDPVDPLESIRQRQASGDFAGSIEPLRKLRAEHPDDPAVNFFYGRALSLTHQSSLATWSLRKAMEDPEWLVPAGMQLAFAALVGRDFNEVVELTGQILAHDPDNLGALLYRANAQAHWKKDPELALADANRVLELDPDKLEAYEPRILALLGLERLDEASESLAEAGRRLVELDAHEGVLAWHCSTMAAFQEASEDLERAHATWIECLAAHPTDTEVVTNAIVFYDAQGQPNRSQEILRVALTSAPNARNFRVALAQRLQLTGSAAEAEAVLREATQSEQPELAAAAWMDLARLRQAMGEPGAAADALARAVELTHEVGTPDPQLLFEFADTLLLSGRLARALEVAEELSVPAHRQLIRARVAQERRNPARALEAFDEALQLWPDNPWARYHAALAAEELGDFERAISEYRYAVRISPGATDARTRGGALLLAAGNTALALQLLRTGYGQAPLEIEGELLLMYLSRLGGPRVGRGGRGRGPAGRAGGGNGCVGIGAAGRSRRPALRGCTARAGAAVARGERRRFDTGGVREDARGPPRRRCIP